MKKFTPYIKHDVVQRYLDGGTSYRQLAGRVGVDDSVIRYWVKLYKYHEEKAFIPVYPSYSPDFKMRVIQFIETMNYSIREASALFRIPDYSMVARWKKKWDKGGAEALDRSGKGQPEMTNKKHDSQNEQPKSYEDLQEENELLHMEIAYLKKLRGLSSKTRHPKHSKRFKVEAIDELRRKQGYSADRLCKIAGLPRSTFYYQVKVMNETDPDEEIRTEIHEIFEEHDGLYGYRRVHMELRNRNYLVNPKKVFRIMKEDNLKCEVRARKYYSYGGKVGTVSDNVLNREFKAEKPNEKWATDITEFKLFGQKIYLSPVQDLFNGEIITYTWGYRPTYALVETMLESAFESLSESDDLLLHSDQGWHYQMPQFVRRLQREGVVQSMSRKGNCHDNAVMENFFGIFKAEFLYRKSFENMKDFERQMDTYIHYYNTKRIKERLNGQSPTKYRQKILEAV
ncbi:IS3 family transposase [Pontibacillus sp. ALD_SL1]|uniref:IS3 family transposase n=1 Tax=Pontibacillus sp. ALD_SL1 TaxID=2777185 RepID=UPI003530349B